MGLKVGLLALQGAVGLHAAAVRALGVHPRRGAHR